MKNSRNQYHYAIRRVKRKEATIRNNKFIKCCLEGNVDNLLKEVKKLQGIKSKNSTTIDGKVGDKNIANHFSAIYEGLYNSVISDDALGVLLDEINENISEEDLQDVDKITSSVIKDSIDNLKMGKSDVQYDWKSEAFIHGIDALASPLAFLFKSFLIHGHISTFILLCALVPIVKDTHGEKRSSSNYRAIAISSIIMKIFDHILLKLFGDKLAPSCYQFGFMKNCSTTMCSFVVTETINYFTNRKTPIYLCLLDLTKAFDQVEFSTLFRKLWGRLPSIILRLLIFSYQNQECLIKWNNTLSRRFSIKNGVRQGAVASPIFFSIYLDDLFSILKKSNLGCYINKHFYGMSGYADDCAILSPDREGLQKMLNKCKDYFDEHKIIISTKSQEK